MPDTPDYSRYLPGSVRFSMQDSGELAARLGSSVVYDRRGETLQIIDFSHSFNSIGLAGSFGRGLLSLVARPNTHSGYAAHMLTGNVTNDFINLGTSIPVQEISKMGFEVSVSRFTSTDYVDIYLQANESGMFTRFAVRLEMATGKIYYYDAAQAWIELTTLLFQVSNGSIFHNIKIVGNFDTHAYYRLMVDSIRFENLSIPAYHAVQAVDDNIFCFIQLSTNANLTGECEIGHMIITGNEP